MEGLGQLSLLVPATQKLAPAALHRFRGTDYSGRLPQAGLRAAGADSSAGWYEMSSLGILSCGIHPDNYEINP
jgi:hypothetical protein